MGKGKSYIRALAGVVRRRQAETSATHRSPDRTYEQPTYAWSVSAGTIVRGQGTLSIVVNTEGLAGDTEVTATITVAGIDPACQPTASCISKTLHRVPQDERRQAENKNTRARKTAIAGEFSQSLSEEFLK